MTDTTYTYQGGRRLPLSQTATSFVSRAPKQDLLCECLDPFEDLSAHSWSVHTNADRFEDDLRRARELGPAYPNYQVQSTGSSFLVTDRIFIRFRGTSDATDRGAHDFARDHGLEVIEHLSPRDVLYRVPPTKDPVDVVRTLTESDLSQVELVDHDLNIQPQDNELAPGESYGALQWHLLSDINDSLIRKCALLDCEGAWKMNGFGKEEVVIAVVDCGCDLFDPNFGPGKFADWAVLLDGELHSKDTFVPDSESIMNPPRLHGTVCATLAAASLNQFGGLGAAPNCRLLPVKWQDLSGTPSLSQSLFFKIVSYLRDKADIVSNSWNRGPDGYWPPAIREHLADAALNGGIHGNGMIWIWAAGNLNCPIDHQSDVRVPIRVAMNGDVAHVMESSSVFTNSFVDIPGVLHIGSISSLGQRCHYSNYGKGLDLVAPSGNFHLYHREAVAGIDLLAPLRERGLYPLRGTSASAPLVAGAAALVRSANPKLKAKEIVSILRRTADKDLSMNGYDHSGRSSDPDPDWDVSPIAPFDSGHFRPIDHPDGEWSPWFGFGKVNARRAVEAAVELVHKSRSDFV